MIEKVQRRITVTRGGVVSSNELKTVARVNQKYIVATNEVKNWGIDVYGHVLVWIVWNDEVTQVIKGGFKTKGEAIRYAESLSEDNFAKQLALTHPPEGHVHWEVIGNKWVRFPK